MASQIESIIRDLENKKVLIERAKQDKARQEGQLEQIWKSLASYGIETVSALEDRIEDITRKMQQAQDKIEKGYEKLKSQYRWE